MLETVLRHLKNWFLVPDGIHEGTYTIKDGGVALPFLADGQYFRICGSIFNDGLHQYPAEDLNEEVFDGVVWALAVPKAVIDLSAEIAEWQTKYGAAAMGPYQSESFAGYTYTKATNAKNGGTVTWESAFASRLNQWRRIREL